MAEVTVPMEDPKLSDLMTDEPAQVEAPEQRQEPEAEPEQKLDHPTDPNRYRDGTYKPKHQEAVQSTAEVATKVADPAPQEPKDDAQVPSWRLREVREAREAAERRAEEATRQAYATQQQMAEMRRQLEALQKPKTEPVDFFQSPEEAFSQRIAPVQSDIESFKRDIRLEFSRELAVIKHGEPLVAEVESSIAKAMQSNHPDMPHLSAQMRNSNNPVAVAIQWHQRNKLMESTGGNLETYKAKVLEEAMKDPAFQAKVIEATRGQTNRPSPVVQLPPSLNKATGSGVSSADLGDNDMSDAALFRHAAAPAKRGAR